MGLSNFVQLRRGEMVSALRVQDAAGRCPELTRQVFQIALFPFQCDYPLRHGFNRDSNRPGLKETVWQDVTKRFVPESDRPNSRAPPHALKRTRDLMA